MTKSYINRKAIEMVKSVSKYAKRRGLTASDYIYEKDVHALSMLLEKGFEESGLRKFYSQTLKENIDADVCHEVRSLPRENYFALEEAGRFLDNDGTIQDNDPYLNTDFNGFFKTPPAEYKSSSSKTGKIRSMGKCLLSASLIAAIMGNALASVYSPTSEINASYPAPIYNEKHLLDKDHNLAVSFPEMLMGLGSHGLEPIGSYLGHTFFFADLDSDGDRIIDSDEKLVYQTNPDNSDSDGDGIKDMDEIQKKYDPNNPNMDNDNELDGTDNDPYRPGKFWSKFTEHPESQRPVPPGYSISEDIDYEYTIARGKAFPLKEGYSLEVKEVDLNGNNAYFELYKNGKKIDSAIVTPFVDLSDESENAADGWYTYGKARVRFTDLFRGPDCALAKIENDWDGGKETFLIVGRSVDVDEHHSMKLGAIDINGEKAYVELYYRWGTHYNDLSGGGTTYHYRLVDSKVVGPIKKLSGPDISSHNTNVQVHFKDIMRVYPHKGNNFGLVMIDDISFGSDDSFINAPGSNTSKKTLGQGGTLDIGKGYLIELADVDMDGKRAYVKLYKNKKLVDEKILGPFGPTVEENYQYGDGILVHFKSFFCGMENKLAESDFVRQTFDREGVHLTNENKEKTIISEKKPLLLGQGYQLHILGADSQSKKAWISLYKDGLLVDNEIIGPIKSTTGDELYTNQGYDANGKMNDFTTIALHVKNVWRDSGNGLLGLDGIWQISKDRPE